MKKYKICKFLAFLLCALMLTVTIAATVGTVVFAEEGLYEGTITDMQAQQLRSHLSELAEDIAIQYAAKNSSNCPQSLIDDYVGSFYLEKLLVSGRWYYTLEDMNGKLLDSSSCLVEGTVFPYEFVITPEYPTVLSTTDYESSFFPPGMLDNILDDENQELPAGTQVDDLPVGQDAEFLRSQGYKWTDENGTHAVTLGIYQGPTYLVTLNLLYGAYEQPDSWEWDLLEIAHQHRFTVLILLGVSLLLFAGSAVYLCYAAGKEAPHSVPVVAGLNKLPLDLYLLLVGGGIFFTLVNIFNIAYWIADPSYILPGAILIGLSGFTGCLLFVGFLYAVATQIKQKNGYWWQHSALRHTGRGLGKLLKLGSKRFNQFLVQVPTVWQWVCLGCILLVSLVIAILRGSIAGVTAVVLTGILVLMYVTYALGALLEHTRRMGSGDLDKKVPTKPFIGCFRSYAQHLNQLADVAVVAAKREMRSERMKAELITNVSHDIKTPLTSIINYVDLLQKAQSPEERQACLEVLERQSQRMKRLIEDLVEMSKASSGSITAEPAEADGAETVNQALGEFSDKLAAARLTPVFQPPEVPVSIYADGRLTWRVLSNLLSNACKYAMPDTRLYVDITQDENHAYLSIKNISKAPLNLDPEDLMERFVRGDTSRNTEGSGLGLNIAQSLMELQHGQLLLEVDGDLFKAVLKFPKPPAMCS